MNELDKRMEQTARDIDLLQHGSLDPVGQLKDPKNFDRNYFHNTYCLLERYAVQRDFAALAINQVNSKAFEACNFAPIIHYPAIIYFTNYASNHLDDENPFNGHLLINPTLEVERDTLGWAEACGSIRSLKVCMWVQRPKAVAVSGLLWSPQKGFSSIDHFRLIGPSAKVMVHEYHHLLGHTQLDYPHEIIDFRQLKTTLDWNDATHYQFPHTPESYMDFYRDRDWLVYDARKKKFLVVKSDGTFVEEFRIN